MAGQLSRRDFLAGCGGLTALAFADFNAQARAAGITYHVHPHYREQLPLEQLLQKRIAGSDMFVLEKEHDAVARILAAWSEDLRSGRRESILSCLAPGFEGSSFLFQQYGAVRNSPMVRVAEFEAQIPPVRREVFFNGLDGYLNSFSQLLTAEFQVTDITEAADGLQTEVRYELVGAGKDFYREQRSGLWQLRWEKNASGTYLLQRWLASREMRSQSKAPAFRDITHHALGENASYSEQLTRGVDYWRTVLDGASRIDIYGHNGIAAGDIDGNGLDDLYVCQPAGLPNRLYKNRGDGTFEDVTEDSGVGVLENTACALFADFSNTGRQDLLVVRAEGPLLFVNDGAGKFQQKHDAFGFATEPQGTFTGAAVADYNRDGLLDVYFCLYVYYQGTDQYKYPTPYYDAKNGPPNFLFRNAGDGTFVDVTVDAGLTQNNDRYSFCCAWVDADNDGWPDLYVVNDFGKKNLYRNNGNGTFTDIAAPAGVEDVGAGMSVCCFDYDGDGASDLYVGDMWTAAGVRITTQKEFREASPAPLRTVYRKHAMGNSLLRNKGDDRFEDATAAAGVGMGRWAWSCDTWDFDHDGHPDLYATNGMISGPITEDLNSFFWRQVVANSPDEAKPAHAYEQGWGAVNELIRTDYSWSGYERNVFYANNGDGTFSDISGAIGLDFLEDGRSFALGDFDGDGRLEIVLKNRNAPQLRILKNVVQDLPASISFRLRGTKSNRDAIGAVITIESSEGKQTRALMAGSGFLSQHSKEMFFGLGAAKGKCKATIKWPSGLEQLLEDIPAGHRIYVDEGVESYHTESFGRVHVPESEAQEPEKLPDVTETWLLSPVAAPGFKASTKPRLLYFFGPGQDAMAMQGSRGLDVTAANVNDHDDDTAIYNILFRSVFDRHRDLTLPAGFLIDEQGDIVKVYQGALSIDQVERDAREIPKTKEERIAKALPFRGNNSFDFGRNNLSLGSVYFQRGYFECAETWFRLALRDDPESAEAEYGLGSVYLKQGSRPEAQARFEQVLKLTAGYPGTKPNAWNNLGLIAAQDGRTDGAIEYFKEALQVDPDHLVALQNLGNAYRREKRWDEARIALEHALEIGPDEPEVNYDLAMVFAQMDQASRAYELLQRALLLKPNYPEAMNNLGVLYLRTRRRDEAVAEFEACIKVSPNYDQSYLNLARVYYIEGNREKARQTLLALLKENPNDPQAQQALDEMK